jgi:WD40 repeat protein
MQKIVHEGEVNRARYQFENPNIIATKSRSGEVYIFDRTTHESFPKENEPFNPALKLKGHTQEGYGLAWNPHKSKSTHLLSAGFDKVICHWDISAASRDNREIQPLMKYEGHTDSVMVKEKNKEKQHSNNKGNTTRMFHGIKSMTRYSLLLVMINHYSCKICTCYLTCFTNYFFLDGIQEM